MNEKYITRISDNQDLVCGPNDFMVNCATMEDANSLVDYLNHLKAQLVESEATSEERRVALARDCVEFCGLYWYCKDPNCNAHATQPKDIKAHHPKCRLSKLIEEKP